ncbi:unnamed protein product [Sphenostylis stenocarpa]|uniref:Uncharacterized protein n=1 Tax=Sphenostylis stenocarpa TaxID=92480 RepID=A0AA86STZ2_9FABA|nr:unnamed protein product [Sphenostylis stenocarpa]
MLQILHNSLIIGEKLSFSELLISSITYTRNVNISEATIHFEKDSSLDYGMLRYPKICNLD